MNKTIMDQLRDKASRAYCDYIDQMSKTECLGWEQKVKSGKFGSTELAAHNLAYKLLGKHVGYSEAAKMLEEIASLDPWIKVEDGLLSEPKEDARYIFRYKDGEDAIFDYSIEANLWAGFPIGVLKHDEFLKMVKKEFTHYKPIVDPK